VRFGQDGLTCSAAVAVASPAEVEKNMKRARLVTTVTFKDGTHRKYETTAIRPHVG